MNYTVDTEQRNRSPDETSVFAWEVIETESGQYCCSILATAQGAYHIGPAAANTIIEAFSDLVDRFEEVQEQWKEAVVKMYRAVNHALYEAAAEQNISALISACTVMVAPDGTLITISTGNVSCIILNDAAAVRGNRLETVGAIKLGKGESSLQVEKNILVSAIGLDTNHRSKTTRAKLQGNETLLLASSGFSACDEMFYRGCLEKRRSERLAGDLISYIANKRGRACGDAVMVIRLEGGEDHGTEDGRTEAGISEEKA